jgi:hypothetical protein
MSLLKLVQEVSLRCLLVGPRPQWAGMMRLDAIVVCASHRLREEFAFDGACFESQQTTMRGSQVVHIFILYCILSALNHGAKLLTSQRRDKGWDMTDLSGDEAIVW